MELIIVFIVLGIVFLGVVAALSLIVYNQLLMVNEVNKRLLLLASESMERERITADDLKEQLDRVQPTEAGAYNIKQDAFDADTEEGFDPHLYGNDL